MSLGSLAIGAATIDCSRNEFLYPHPVLESAHWPQLGSDSICRYQPSARLLTHLAERFGCDRTDLRVHNGAESALKAIFAGIARIPDATLLLPEPGWDFHAGLAKTYGIRTELYQYVDRGDRYLPDVASLLTQIEQVDRPVLLLVSPSNPLGGRLPDELLSTLARRVAGRGYCIVDQAYAGFAAGPTLDWSIGELLTTMPSTVLVRTMSKYYGIPGLRVGFTAAVPAVHEGLGLEPDYLGFNAFSDEFAVRCLEAHAEFERIADAVMTQRDALAARLSALPGFRAYASDANFLLVRTADPVYASWLAEHGVKVRTFATAELRDCVRITVPPEAGVQLIVEATESFSQTRRFAPTPVTRVLAGSDACTPR
jgi:histidinol-phosphate aminotransferase